MQREAGAPFGRDEQLGTGGPAHVQEVPPYTVTKYLPGQDW